MSFKDFVSEGKLFGGLKQSLSPDSKVPPTQLATSVRQLYKDEKNQAELDEMIKELNGIIKDYNDIEAAATTILRRDVELEKAFMLTKDVLLKTVQMVRARKAVGEK